MSGFRYHTRVRVRSSVTGALSDTEPARPPHAALSVALLLTPTYKPLDRPARPTPASSPPHWGRDNLAKIPYAMEATKQPPPPLFTEPPLSSWPIAFVVAVCSVCSTGGPAASSGATLVFLLRTCRVLFLGRFGGPLNLQVYCACAGRAGPTAQVQTPRELSNVGNLAAPRPCCRATTTTWCGKLSAEYGSHNNNAV